MLALLRGCGFRRSELVYLTIEYLQQREEHRAPVDLVGKSGHVRAHRRNRREVGAKEPTRKGHTSCGHGAVAPDSFPMKKESKPALVQQ